MSSGRGASGADGRSPTAGRKPAPSQGEGEGGQDALLAARSLSFWVFGVSLAALILLPLRRVRAFGPLAWVLAAYSFLILLGIMVDARLVDRFNTTKRLACAINHAGYADAAIVNYGSFDETLPFYTGKRVYVADYKGELETGAAYPEAKAYFLDAGGLVRLWRSGRPVFVVFKERRLDRLKELGLAGSGHPWCEEGRCLIASQGAASPIPSYSAMGQVGK